MILATVFSFENDFPREIQDYLEQCLFFINPANDSTIQFPLNLNADDFEDLSSNIIDAYLEVVRYMSANLIAGSTYAYIE